MKRWQIIILSPVIFLLFFSLGMKFYRALEPSFSAIAYLETQGYKSVRITGNLPKGIGCDPEDAYRYTFDAIPAEGKKRVDGWVCGGEAEWYQEK